LNNSKPPKPFARLISSVFPVKTGFLETKRNSKFSLKTKKQVAAREKAPYNISQETKKHG
jgi:hypothetical protein